MKAVRLYAHGGPEMLVHDDVAMPEIHAILPMARVAEAHRLLESGTVSDRVLLDPWSD